MIADYLLVRGKSMLAQSVMVVVIMLTEKNNVRHVGVHDGGI